MKKLIDIDENNLSAFRRVVALHFPDYKITDKMLVNLALHLAYSSLKNSHEISALDFLGLCKYFLDKKNN